MLTEIKVTPVVLAYVGWTLTSFLCHWSAKIFLRTGTADTNLKSGFCWAVIITLAQMTACCLFTRLRNVDASSARAQKIMWIKGLCHVLATLSTNYSMTLIHASSTFAVKLLEPVTSAIVQFLVLRTTVSRQSILSLPVIIGGAVAFIWSSTDTPISAVGVTMALLSNIILAFRNVAVKLENLTDSGHTIELRHTIAIGIVVTAGSILVVLMSFLASRGLMSFDLTKLVATLMSASVFHVIYSYTSTNIVLFYMTVVTHSVANVFKRVIVVLLLYSFGQRKATAGNFSGLAISTVGLVVYVWNQKKERDPKSVLLSASGLKIGIVFLLCICGLALSPYCVNNTTRSLGWSQNKSKLSIRLMEEERLILTPQETNLLSPHLHSALDVIAEAQRIHINLFTDLFANYKYAMLFDLAAFENKGDPAISTGEVYLLRRLGIRLLFYCNLFACTDKNLDYAKRISTKYSPNDLVLLLHGGGNIVGYPLADHHRANVFKRFPNFMKVLFPQSIYLPAITHLSGNDTRPQGSIIHQVSNNPHLKYCQDLYKNQDNFTMILRDKQSLNYAKEYFSGKAKLMMAPDMAFQIGYVPRFISPSFDIMWIKRKDRESPGYSLPKFPPGVSVHCADWLDWKTQKADTTMETAFMVAHNGFVFVQRGRVVITDRLHGHILSILSNIPHVLIDNKEHKLSAYHYTWTSGLDNTVLAHNATHALELALMLLKKYKNVLSPIVPFMDVREWAP